MDPNNYRGISGNNCVLIDLDSSSAIPASLVPGTNCLDLGGIKDTKSGKKSSANVEKTEDTATIGQTITSEGKTVLDLLESDKPKADYLAFMTGNKLQIKYVGLSAGKKMERMSIVNALPQDAQDTDGHMPFESTDITPGADIVISAANMTAIKAAFPNAKIFAAGPFTLLAGKERLLVLTT